LTKIEIRKIHERVHKITSLAMFRHLVERHFHNGPFISRFGLEEFEDPMTQGLR
jgi:hypothetical protein